MRGKILYYNVIALSIWLYRASRVVTDQMKITTMYRTSVDILVFYRLKPGQTECLNILTGIEFEHTFHSSCLIANPSLHAVGTPVRDHRRKLLVY